jgi:hypothetical protein
VADDLVGSAVSPAPRRQRLAAWICASPELIACGLAAFCLPLMIALLAGDVVWPVLIPVSALFAIAVTVVCGPSTERIDRRTFRFTLIAIPRPTTWPDAG